MTPDEWIDANNRYLAASLEWLREVLEHFADGSRPPAGEEPASPLRRGWGRPDEPARAPSCSSKAAAEARAQAAAIDPPPALLLLARRLQLSDFERDTLLLCAAVEFDPGFAERCGAAQGSGARGYPTFGLALSVLDDPSWDALSPHRPLRYARLLEINQPGATPLTAAALRADERVVNFLKGLNAIDERLAMLFRPAGETTPLSLSQSSVGDALVERLGGGRHAGAAPVVQLVGPDGESRLAVARDVAAAFGRRLYRAGCDALPTGQADLESVARLWEREARLLPVALYVDADHEGTSTEEAQAHTALRRFLTGDVGLVFVGLRDAPLQVPGPTLAVDVEKPTSDEQRDAWTAALAALPGADAEAADATAALLAGQFRLNLRTIGDVVAQEEAAPDAASLPRQLWTACRDVTRPRMDELAQRLEPKATWDDLVLPDEQMKLMRSIAGQVRQRHRVYSEWGFRDVMNRGFGINALFAGESGTGKTMAAEVLANDLELNLYRIDLSAVVSKYIGETEKNLRRLFDAAEQGGAILLFDEADALFGKRSEVKDSHDRYANIEINYLLQRIEGFSGLAILATNMRGAIDPAFLRRLRFVVTFQFPGAKERRRIWERALPGRVPRHELDYGRLARMNLTGGNIHSIALNAAFAAAQAGQAVSMPILLEAARAELRKLDKAVNEAEFRVLEPVNGKA